jgi:hypothetical protein
MFKNRFGGILKPREAESKGRQIRKEDRKLCVGTISVNRTSDNRASEVGHLPDVAILKLHRR